MRATQQLFVVCLTASLIIWCACNTYTQKSVMIIIMDSKVHLVHIINKLQKIGPECPKMTLILHLKLPFDNARSNWINCTSMQFKTYPLEQWPEIMTFNLNWKLRFDHLISNYLNMATPDRLHVSDSTNQITYISSIQLSSADYSKCAQNVIKLSKYLDFIDIFVHKQQCPFCASTALS